jgi:hypothetical protein
MAALLHPSTNGWLSSHYFLGTLLIALIRVLAVILLCAIPAIVMPFSWMDRVHRALAMGPLPSEPIVDYLARSLSMMYATHGAALWFMSRNVHRYSPLLRFSALLVIIMGIALLGIDVAAGMPLWWGAVEGPSVVAFGLVLYLLLSRREFQPD